MDQAEKSGMDKAQYLIGIVILCVAVLLGATAYFGANKAMDVTANLSAAINATSGAGLPALGVRANASAGNGTIALNATADGNTTQAAARKEVTIDFLYLDSCPHCQRMKPIVASLAAAMPSDRFEVRYWNYASSSADPATAAVYADYGAKGYFQGSVPTFVANWDDYRVGAMTEQDFKAWVCSKFSAPKPSGC